jgi:hypothetical protein
MRSRSKYPTHSPWSAKAGLVNSCQPPFLQSLLPSLRVADESEAASTSYWWKGRSTHSLSEYFFVMSAKWGDSGLVDWE